jgi:hypothetical protein
MFVSWRIPDARIQDNWKFVVLDTFMIVLLSIKITLMEFQRTVSTQSLLYME